MDRTTVIRVMKALNNVGTEDLARSAGVSRDAVWNWESGRRPVSAQTARRIEDALLGRNGTVTASREKSGVA